MVGTDKNNFPHNLLLSNRQVACLCKAFVNSSSKDMELWNYQRVNYDEECADAVGHNCVCTIRITEATSAAEVGIHEKILRFGTTMLIISN